MSLMESPGHQTSQLSPGLGRLTLGAVGSGVAPPSQPPGSIKGFSEQAGDRGGGLRVGCARGAQAR